VGQRRHRGGKDDVGDLVERPRGVLLPTQRCFGAVDRGDDRLGNRREAFLRLVRPEVVVELRDQDRQRQARQRPGCRSASPARCSGGEIRIAPSMCSATGSLAPYFRHSSVPKDQPTSQMFVRPWSTAHRHGRFHVVPFGAAAVEGSLAAAAR
jgi:hypothetical protein